MFFFESFKSEGNISWIYREARDNYINKLRASFKNKVGPEGINRNGKDVVLNPFRWNRKKNANRLGSGFEDTNPDPSPDQCLDCPDEPRPAPPKEIKELENRVGNLEKRVQNLEATPPVTSSASSSTSSSMSSSTSSTTTLQNVHPRKRFWNYFCLQYHLISLCLFILIISPWFWSNLQNLRNMKNESGVVSAAYLCFSRFKMLEIALN